MDRAQKELLVADLTSSRDDGRRIEVAVLDGERDGVEQISNLLAQYQDLDAVHLVSHGTERAVHPIRSKGTGESFDPREDKKPGERAPAIDFLVHVLRG